MWGDFKSLGNGYGYVRNNPASYVDPLGLWYIDINVSGGYWGGGTGGLLIAPEGIYPYLGGGLVSPFGGFSLTWSPQSPSTGWNYGVIGGFWIGWGWGYSKVGGAYWEIGFKTPGGSGTGYYVYDPWKWPWQERCKK